MKNLLLVILFIFIGQTLGSLIGLIKRPRDTFLHASLAFSASMMLGISFFQLIPEALKITPPLLVIIFFFSGIIVMRLTDKILPHIDPGLFKGEKSSLKKTVTMLIVGIALHNFPEGLAIGVGFVALASGGLCALLLSL